MLRQPRLIHYLDFILMLLIAINLYHSKTFIIYLFFVGEKMFVQVKTLDQVRQSEAVNLPTSVHEILSMSQLYDDISSMKILSLLCDRTASQEISSQSRNEISFICSPFIASHIAFRIAFHITPQSNNAPYSSSFI